MDPIPILPSASDMERRRLEDTIDQDLDSLSLGSLLTTSASDRSKSPSQSLSSISSLEYPRAFGEGNTGRSLSFGHPADRIQPESAYNTYDKHHGPHGTPRAAPRNASAFSMVSEMNSPVSTAGHHVSAMTLGEGVFRTKGDDAQSSDEFDPERSLGRLVGELGKVMNATVSPRPTSPFVALSPPRSPSPYSSFRHNDGQNLSLTLSRNDPLPSPPSSRSASASSAESAAVGTKHGQSSSRFSSFARDLVDEIRTRRPLGESTTQNVASAPSATPMPKRAAASKDRVRTLQSEKRPFSAPPRMDGDMTGMTALLETPAKGAGHEKLDKNGQVGGDAGAGIPQTLATLHARLRALETENSLSRRRIKELEGELERARGEVEGARRHGAGRMREVIGEKSALEDLVKSLRSHLARLTVELEQNKALVAQLRTSQSQAAHVSPPRPNSSVTDELVKLRIEVERLGTEVHRLGGIVEEGLDTRRRARGERTMRMEEEEAARLAREVAEEDVDRVRADMAKRQSCPPPTPGPSRLEQGLQAAATVSPTVSPTTSPAILAPSSVAPSTRTLPSHRTTRMPSESPEVAPSTRPLPNHKTPRMPSESPESVAPSTRTLPTHKTPRLPLTVAPSTRTLPSHRSSRHGQQATVSSGSDDGASSPTPSLRTVRAANRSLCSPRVDGPGSPFPSIRDEDEPDFFSTLGRETGTGPSPWSKKFQNAARSKHVIKTTDDRLPPQTVLARVISELEADFVHYRAIYSELADQYKVLDPAAIAAKRRVLAQHLREVIDTLEQKADQISTLYELLTYSDKEDTRSTRPSNGKSTAAHTRSVPDVLRLVRHTLGEDGMRRLAEDGVRLGSGTRCGTGLGKGL